MKNKILAIISLAALLPLPAFGDMTSTNYTIYSDAVGVSGGEPSTSTSFTLSDTFSEPGAVTGTSSTYVVRGGYQATTRGTLNFSISNSSLQLGTLSVASVSAVSTTVTISADDAGYVLSISNVTGIVPPTVAGGSVLPGEEEYGLSATGTYSMVSGDVGVTNGLVLAASPIPVLNDQTVLTFKASTNGSGANAGTYSQTIDLIAVANF